MQITAKVEDGKVRQSLSAIGDVIPGVNSRNMKYVMEQIQYEGSGGYSGGASYSVPPPQGSTYQRTGDYGSKFSVEQNSRMSYTLHSDSDHATVVGGYADGSGQAQIHTGRWPLVAEVAKKWLETLIQDIDRELGEIMRQMGIGL